MTNRPRLVMKGYRTMRSWATVAVAVFGSMVWAGTEGWAGLETISLKDGHQVTGEVVAEKPNALYVDLGFDSSAFLATRSARGASRARAPRRSSRRRRASAEADPTGFFTSGPLEVGAGARSWSRSTARR